VITPPPTFQIPEAAIDAATRAIRDLLRERVSDSDMHETEVQEFFLSLQTESSRALAIVVFSYIDDKLRALMLSHFNPGIAGGAESLFDGFGPLSTASSRIKVAGGLWWLSPMTYRHLELLRRIRNEFAHNPFLATFDESPVRDLLAQFSPVEEEPWRLMADDLIAHGTATRRQLFHVRAVLTCSHMIQELRANPIALKMGLSPSALIEDGFAVFPERFKESIRSALKVMVSIAAKPRA